MIRALIFVVWVIFLAYMGTWLLSLEGRVPIDIFGKKMAPQTGVAILIVITLFLITIGATIVIKDLWAMPAKMKAKNERNKLNRGMAALTRGLESVAAGDGSDAQHHARIAKRNLGDGAMTRLLSAQAAQLSGDEDAAGESFTAMLEAPETEFLGLRGLYEKARRDEDEEAARQYAERAFTLRPNAAWAFESVFDLALDRGAWGEARSHLKPAVRNKALAPDRAKRAEAALLTAEAYAANDSDDKAGALDDIEKALKIAPSFAPAAVLAAELHHAAGRGGRAEKILEQAYAATPHISLVHALASLYGPSEAGKAATFLRKLAERQPDARESGVAKAHAFMLDTDYDAAIETLEPLLTDRASAGDCALMAEAVAGAHASTVGESAARGWLARAAAAERDPTPGADGVFRFTRAGWAQLVRTYRDDGLLAPTPLEGPPPGLTQEDFKLLAPPAAVLPPPTPEDKPIEAVTATDEPSSNTDDEPQLDNGTNAGSPETPAEAEAPSLDGDADQSDADTPDAAHSTEDHDAGIDAASEGDVSASENGDTQEAKTSETEETDTNPKTDDAQSSDDTAADARDETHDSATKTP
ncbi:MAG: heme biosynthesis HemY N-terminal domain-containing protein [Pseudomonadota bacterium]